MDVLKGAMKDSVSSAVLPPGGPLGKPVDVEAIVKDVKVGIVEVASGFTPQKVAFEIGGMVFIWFQGLINSRKKAIEVAKLERHQYNSFIFDIAKKAWTSGASKEASNGVSNEASNEASNGASNGVSNGLSNEASNGVSNEASNGVSNGASNGASNGVSNGVSNEASNGASNGATVASENNSNAKVNTPLEAPSEVTANEAPVQAVRSPNNTLAIREPNTQQKENMP